MPAGTLILGFLNFWTEKSFLWLTVWCYIRASSNLLEQNKFTSVFKLIQKHCCRTCRWIFGKMSGLNRQRAVTITNSSFVRSLNTYILSYYTVFQKDNSMVIGQVCFLVLLLNVLRAKCTKSFPRREGWNLWVVIFMWHTILKTLVLWY